MSVRVAVRGVGVAIAAVKAKALQHMENASRVVSETAVEIQREAKHLAPVRTGNLRNSIQAEFPEKLRAYVKAYAPYAHFVEYGTSKMSARPYMRPAVETVRSRLKGLKKGLKKR